MDLEENQVARRKRIVENNVIWLQSNKKLENASEMFQKTSHVHYKIKKVTFSSLHYTHTHIHH